MGNFQLNAILFTEKLKDKTMWKVACEIKAWHVAFERLSATTISCVVLNRMSQYKT